MIQKNIVLFGAPGVGKGTYGRLIKKEFGIPVFSTGDYLRGITAAKPETMNPWKLAVKEKIDKGHFIDDESIINIVLKARQTDYADQETFILDGVPRTLNQAKMLKEHLEIDCIFNMTMD